MRTTIIAIVAFVSIASARAATEKALSPATGHSPALVSSTVVLPTDSRLVRAAKLTVAGRLHPAGANVFVINDSMVGHSTTLLGESAPSNGSGYSSRGAAGLPAGQSPGASPAAAAQKVQSLQMEQQRMGHEADQPYGDNLNVDYAQKRLQEIPGEIRAAQNPAPPPPQQPQ